MEPKNKKRKILILGVPFSDHINPMTGMVHELTSHHHCHIIFYGIPELKQIIEKTGAEYRPYSYFPIDNFKRKPTNQKQDSTFMQVALEMVDLSDRILPELEKIVILERPDLIIYDTWALFTKFLLQILDQKHKKGFLQHPPPPAVMFSPFFGFKPGVYPSNRQYEMIMGYDLNFYLKYIYLFFKQLMLNFKYGLSYYDTIDLLFKHTGKMNIIATFYDLQPKVDLFDDNDHFVGCCISETVRAQSISDEKLKACLDLFEAKNPVESLILVKSNGLKLIYASLGTIFNNNFYIYECMVDAVRTFDDEVERCNVGKEQIRLVVSVGSEVFEIYEDKIKKGVCSAW